MSAGPETVSDVLGLMGRISEVDEEIKRERERLKCYEDSRKTLVDKLALASSELRAEARRAMQRHMKVLDSLVGSEGEGGQSGDGD